MTNVTNNYSAPLGLPDGQLIPANTTVKVENWNIVKDHPVVKSWIDTKALSAGRAKDEDSGKPDDGKDPLDEKTKAELVDYAKEKGISVDQSAKKEDILAAIKAAEQSAS